MAAARITSFLVKLASRCNLDCDYCYVYHHADQGWRKMPRLLSEEHREAFAERLAEYVRAAGLKRVAAIFHGGEPLLAGYAPIVQFTRRLRAAVGPDVEVDAGLQTNGLLLTDEALEAFASERVAVSLSMDGPREAQDLHRLSRKGRSSFDRVEAALERLKRYPGVFAGVIAVIDASVRPETLLSYFAGHQVPNLDFLLPDSHHERGPPGRELMPALYEDWLIEGFDAWFDRYPDLPVRTFDALLDAAAGLPSGTDAFGFGDVSLITLETDGTWHDLDVLKVVGEGATRLVGTVLDTAIEQVASSTALAAHRRLLTKSGLSEKCRACEVVDVCGGGSVPHRFGHGDFENPTVYCREMKALITHVAQRVRDSLNVEPASATVPVEIDLDAFELAETSAQIVGELHARAVDIDLEGFETALRSAGRLDLLDSQPGDLRRLASRAGSVAWQRAMQAKQEGRVARDVDGDPISADITYVDRAIELSSGIHQLEVGTDDEWLRLPFGTGIVFEDEAVAAEGRALVKEALAIVEAWRPALADELRGICSGVQFVRDPSAHPEKIVSFSDDSAPGALFVSISQGEGLIDPYDLADSLVHEYRHQKLYLLERRHPTTQPGALVKSPWREDLRPVSGLLHAIFVFVELRRFWEHVRDRGPKRLHNRALAQLDDTERNLRDAFETLKGCELTDAGRALAEVLEGRKQRLPLAA